MKKTFFVLLAVVVMITLAGCVGAKKPKPLIQPVNSVQSTEPPQVSNLPDDVNAVNGIFQKYLTALDTCDEEGMSQLITENSKKITKYWCEGMKNEFKCYNGKEYKIVTVGDSGILYFTPFSHDSNWPFYLLKENNNWKIDLFKMNMGLVLAGSQCDSGWGWRNVAIVYDFCSFFAANGCPENLPKSPTKDNN